MFENHIGLHEIHSDLSIPSPVGKSGDKELATKRMNPLVPKAALCIMQFIQGYIIYIGFIPQVRNRNTQSNLPIKTYIVKKEFTNSFKFYQNHRAQIRDHIFSWPYLQNGGIRSTLPWKNFNFASRLLNGVQICSVDLIAIHKAIRTCISKEYEKTIIFTDSQSVISKLQIVANNKINHISCNTKRLLVF